MLIVVPHLANNQELYGIYSFCISFILYLTYSDIGFLSAGQKYAAEEFARGNRIEEIKILGFTAAILLIMVVPFSLGMIYSFFNPNLLISNLSLKGQHIASNIFLIMGVLLPLQVILQRLIQSILIIRIMDYVSLRINILFNLIKIASVFFFFSKGRYMIVGYFLFTTSLTVVSSLIIFFIIKRTFDYDFILLLKSIKLTKKYYKLLNKLAYSSLLLSVGWMIYYELDIIIIGKWFGPKEVAIYAIGFTFLNFLRRLWNTLFSPYAQRFNHFFGIGLEIEMKKLAFKIIDYTLPLCIIVTLILIISTKYLVMFWVGKQYFDSIIIMQLLFAGTGFGFVTQPASYYFMAKTKYNFIYLMALALPIVFILGVAIMGPIINIEGIALSKSIAMFTGFIISIIGISSLVNPLKIIRKWIVNLLVVSGLLIVFLPDFLNLVFNYQNKSALDLVELIIILAGIIGVSYLGILITKQQQRKELSKIIHKVYVRIK